MSAVAATGQGSSGVARAWACSAGAIAVLLATTTLSLSDSVPHRLDLLLGGLHAPQWITPDSIMQVGHLIMWAAISGLAASVARRWWIVLLTVATVITASLAIEVLQGRLTAERVTNRTDAAVNLAGVLFGWAMSRWWRSGGGRRPAHSPTG